MASRSKDTSYTKQSKRRSLPVIPEADQFAKKRRLSCASSENIDREAIFGRPRQPNTEFPVEMCQSLANLEEKGKNIEDILENFHFLHSLVDYYRN